MGGETGFTWDERFLQYDFGPNHPLRPVRVEMTYELIKSLGLLDNENVKLISPRPASYDELRLFHQDSYLRLVQQHSVKGTGYLDLGDTPAFKNCFEISSLIVGASIAMCDQVMTGNVIHAFNPAGGLHHAHPERASGFCIFNDPAVVIAYLKSKYNLKRIVYLDIDAHHGDGVMYGYYSDPSVLDIDFHESGRYLFPGTGYTDETGIGKGMGFKINIPLPPNTGDQAFLNAFKNVVPKLVEEYKPEIILVQCGADGHEHDRLAHLRFTTKMYTEVIREMHRLAHGLCEGRMLLYGGGGYTVANVPRVWTVAFASLVGMELKDVLPQEWRESFRSTVKETPPNSLWDKPTVDSAEIIANVAETVEELFEELDRSS